MISDILGPIANGSVGFTTGSAAADGATNLFGSLLAQVANFFSTAFGS